MTFGNVFAGDAPPAPLRASAGRGRRKPPRRAPQAAPSLVSTSNAVLAFLDMAGRQRGEAANRRASPHPPAGARRHAVEDLWEAVATARRLSAHDAVRDALAGYLALVDIVEKGLWVRADAWLAVVVYTNCGNLLAQTGECKGAQNMYHQALNHLDAMNTAIKGQILHNLAVTCVLLREGGTALSWLAQPCVQALRFSNSLRECLEGNGGQAVGFSPQMLLGSLHALSGTAATAAASGHAQSRGAGVGGHSHNHTAFTPLNPPVKLRRQQQQQQSASHHPASPSRPGRPVGAPPGSASTSGKKQTHSIHDPAASASPHHHQTHHGRLNTSATQDLLGGGGGGFNNITAHPPPPPPPFDDLLFPQRPGANARHRPWTAAVEASIPTALGSATSGGAGRGGMGFAGTSGNGVVCPTGMLESLFTPPMRPCTARLPQALPSQAHGVRSPQPPQAGGDAVPPRTTFPMDLLREQQDWQEPSPPHVLTGQHPNSRIPRTPGDDVDPPRRLSSSAAAARALLPAVQPEADACANSDPPRVVDNANTQIPGGCGTVQRAVPTSNSNSNSSSDRDPTGAGAGVLKPPTPPLQGATATGLTPLATVPPRPPHHRRSRDDTSASAATTSTSASSTSSGRSSPKRRTPSPPLPQESASRNPQSPELSRATNSNSGPHARDVEGAKAAAVAQADAALPPVERSGVPQRPVTSRVRGEGGHFIGSSSSSNSTTTRASAARPTTAEVATRVRLGGAARQEAGGDAASPGKTVEHCMALTPLGVGAVHAVAKGPPSSTGSSGARNHGVPVEKSAPRAATAANDVRSTTAEPTEKAPDATPPSPLVSYFAWDWAAIEAALGVKTTRCSAARVMGGEGVPGLELRLEGDGEDGGRGAGEDPHATKGFMRVLHNGTPRLASVYSREVHAALRRVVVRTATASSPSHALGVDHVYVASCEVVVVHAYDGITLAAAARGVAQQRAAAGEKAPTKTGGGQRTARDLPVDPRQIANLARTLLAGVEAAAASGVAYGAALHPGRLIIPSLDRMAEVRIAGAPLWGVAKASDISSARATVPSCLREEEQERDGADAVHGGIEDETGMSMLQPPEVQAGGVRSSPAPSPVSSAAPGSAPARAATKKADVFRIGALAKWALEHLVLASAPAAGAADAPPRSPTSPLSPLPFANDAETFAAGATWVLAPLVDGLMCGDAEARPTPLEALADAGMWRDVGAWVNDQRLIVDRPRKLAIFRSFMQQLTRGRVEYYMVIRREHIVDDGVEALLAMDDADLLSPLNVTFVGESAVDYGGVANEFCTELANHLLAAPGVFESDVDAAQATQYLPSPGAPLPPMIALGKLLKKCLIDGRSLHLPIAQTFFKYILQDTAGVQLPTTPTEWIAEMMQYDAAYAKQLLQIRDAVGHEGVAHLEELALFDKDDAPILTAAAFDVYVTQCCEEKLVGKRQEQLDAARAGFGMAETPAHVMSLLAPPDLLLLLCGDDGLDGDAILANVEFRNWQTSDSTPYHLCSLIGQLTAPELRLFLRLCTGLSSLPHGGLAKKISIFKSSRLYAHTCFNQLSLPEYPSAQEMYSALQQAFSSLSISPALEDDLLSDAG